jgi:ABC-type multidrug transport system fused ATPase/permease subunit
MSFFDTTPLGRILNRFSKDQYVIDESLTDTLYSYMRQVFAVLGIFIAICSVTPLFACVLIPLLFFYSKIQDYYVSSSRELRRLDSVLRSPIFSHFSETIDGVSIIRAFKSQARFIQTNQLKVDKSLRAYFLYISSNRWLALRLEFIGSIVVGAAAVFAVIGRHSIEPSLAGLSISYALMITQSLNWMVRMSSEREANIVSVERNVEYANVESEGQLIVPDNRPATEWPHSGTIAIDNLVMAYRPGLKPVINGLECIINPKEHIGIVGRTGAGKSSFFLAILRIVEPMKGSIRIDDIDISQIGLADLRSKISVIPQDPILFTGTVRFNLDPFSLYSDADIERVLALVHLKAYVDSLDKKLDFEVQEGGSNFSGGQKQLICLARALLRKSKILFMDEATSSVSRDIDNLIQKTISEEFRDCTVLTIAHRLETVMESDRIFVMSEGKIIESGNPLELLKDSESEFYKLAQSLKNASH